MFSQHNPSARFEHKARPISASLRPRSEQTLHQAEVHVWLSGVQICLAVNINSRNMGLKFYAQILNNGSLTKGRRGKSFVNFQESSNDDEILVIADILTVLPDMLCGEAFFGGEIFNLINNSETSPPDFSDLFKRLFVLIVGRDLQVRAVQ